MAEQQGASLSGVDDRTAFLRRVRLFADLPAEVQRQVAGLLRQRQVSRGGFVFLEGEPAEALHILAEGRVKVIRETDDGREVILRLIHPGEVFGAAGAWGESTYPATAVAQEDAVVFLLATPQLSALLDTPVFARAVIHELSLRLRDAEARIRDLQTERVERRIARVLLRLANRTGQKTPRGIELGTPLSRQDLAELAGTTLSTASRTLSGWDQQGIVEAGRERVTIIKAHQLVAIAEDFPQSAPKA